MSFGFEFIKEIEGKFEIRREFKGICYNFGSFNTMKEARKAVIQLEREGWPVPIIKNKNLIEEHIEKKEDKFIVFKYVKGEKKIFSRRNTLEEAQIAKRNLMSNGWESDLYFAKGEYGKYIRKTGNQFTIEKIIDGERLNYGTFSHLIEAIAERDRLVEENWEIEDYSINSGKYGKYIVFNGTYYIIQKTIDGKIKNFGSYKDLEKAIEERNRLILDGWNTAAIPETNKYIQKTNRGYIIFRRNDNKELISYGTYKTLDEAIKIRDYLIKNNWEVIEENDSYNELEKYIQYDGDYYTIERFVYNDLRIYGIFKNKEQATKEKNRLLSEEWRNTPFVNKTRKWPYGENIVPFDYLFYVRKNPNDEEKQLGPFYSFKDAVEARNKLFNSNKETKLSRNKIIDIFKNISTIDEPEIPFPQATLEDCIDVFNALSKTKMTRDEIVNKFNYQPRRYSFIISAGKYLDLLEQYNGHIELTSNGKSIFELDDHQIKLELVKIILEHKPFYNVFKIYLENNKIPEDNCIITILRNCRIYNIDSDITFKRRSSTVRSWIKWIINLYENDEEH